MADKKVYAKGFGARYGPRVREKHARISKDQSAKYVCPYCKYQQVKRLAVGIWNCKKCNSQFTSKAYKVEKPASVRTVVEEQIIGVEK